ncbi:hypothetical protein [Ensifer sp. 4252]|uniref:hypothetical protein n=1 Tax=Ensifer sp. 4252 TaxID=3373915 RepID=UPI003D25B8E5
MAARIANRFPPGEWRQVSGSVGETDDPTEHPRWRRVGKQMIEGMDPLAKKRMEKIDNETSATAIDFIKHRAGSGQPIFCWFNSSVGGRSTVGERLSPLHPPCMRRHFQ